MNTIKEAIDNAFSSQIHKIYTVFSESFVSANGDEKKTSDAIDKLKKGLEVTQKAHDIAIEVASMKNLGNAQFSNSPKYIISEIDEGIECPDCGGRFNPKYGEHVCKS
ncbi:hypothetical protein ACQKE0_13400 [Shewanella colwelliana]|uniref:hypothetical protein n=1 Tax=Shewanella colwelliana TaxID=23 RepID=UPI003D00988A